MRVRLAVAEMVGEGVDTEARGLREMLRQAEELREERPEAEAWAEGVRVAPLAEGLLE